MWAVTHRQLGFRELLIAGSRLSAPRAESQQTTADDEPACHESKMADCAAEYGVRKRAERTMPEVCYRFRGATMKRCLMEWPVGSIADLTGDGLADFVQVAPMNGPATSRFYVFTSESNFVSYLTVAMGDYVSVVL